MRDLRNSVFDVAAAADILRQARVRRQPVPRVVPDELAQDTDLAYRIQETNTTVWLDEGRRLTGRKIGLTSVAVQRQLGVDQPDYGMLFDDMRFGDNELIPKYTLIQPKAEAEVAFLIATDVTAPLDSIAAARKVVDCAMPAIEIVDSRIANWKINLANTIADNASSGLFVLGDARKTLQEVDPVNVKLIMRRGTEIVSQGSGVDCLGDPLNALIWLANRMIEVGRPLHAGDIVLSGALGPMVDVNPGDVVEADISGLGKVRARFGN